MDELYRAHGEAALNLEIAQARFNQTKQALVEALNKPKSESHDSAKEEAVA